MVLLGAFIAKAIENRLLLPIPFWVILMSFTIAGLLKLRRWPGVQIILGAGRHDLLAVINVAAQFGQLGDVGQSLRIELRRWERGKRSLAVGAVRRTVLKTLAVEAGPIAWVATHRIHHAHTDAPGDPHTPRDGSWWAHMGWVLTGTAQRYDKSVRERYAPDLTSDPVHVWIERLYYVPIILLGFVLLAAGGWPMLFCGIFLRVTFSLHTTWLVNSATHMWGKRRFDTDEDSRNSWWVALLSFGEGWHNNHHAHPTSARHGLRWYEIDFNWWGIRLLQFMGLARRIKRVRFNRASTAWQLVTGRVKSRRSYEGA